MPTVRPWRYLCLWGHEALLQSKLLQWDSTLERAITLATPNYGYEKRQRELAKKKKKEEKLRSKASGSVAHHSGGYVAPDDATAAPTGSAVLPSSDNSTQAG